MGAFAENRLRRVSDKSLDCDAGAGSLEGILRLLSGFLVGLIDDRLRCALTEVLGLLQAEASESANLLDDLDLLFAGTLEDDVELGLLGFSFAASSASRGSGSSSHGGSRGDVERVLELLHELRELDEGHFLECVQQIAGVELRHGGVLPVVRPRGGPDRIGLQPSVGASTSAGAAVSVSVASAGASAVSVSAAGSAGASTGAAGAPAARTD